MSDEQSIDKYGIKAQYQFQVEQKSLTSMSAVINQLQEIERTVESTSNAIDSSGLGKNLTRITSQLSKQTGSISKHLSPLKTEFRALRAEARNIDFGDIGDTKAFAEATTSVNNYIASLKRLESQISGTSSEERELIANLKAQQRVAGDRITLADNQRKAADYGDKIGKSQALRDVGTGTLRALSNPMQNANELGKGLGSIRKLANDLKDVQKLQNSIFTLSADMAIDDNVVTSVFEDLAGAGKSFKPGELEKRIEEARQILKNANALDITVDRSTELEVTLGAKYKDTIAKLPGGAVELTARTGSVINELADKLQDVKISAQDIIPYMKVVMNTVGEAENFKIPDIAAYAAALASTGTIEPEVAGSMLNRLATKISENAPGFAQALGMGLDEFSTLLNQDKLSVITGISEAYKNVEGGEIEQGKFFKSLGIGSAQDQKLFQALASSLDVVKDARKVGGEGFTGKPGEALDALSVEQEINRVMTQSAFQSEKFTQSIKALSDTFGLAIQESMLPFKQILNTVLSATIKLTQTFPFLTKVIATSLYTFAALAATAGTAGVVLFTFRQAAANAAVASVAMRTAIVPLTGFYQTALLAYQGTNPLSGSLILLRTGFTKLVAPMEAASSAMGLVGRASLSFLASPLGVAIASLTGLYLLLEMATPGVSLLGNAIGALGAPFAFIGGVVIGFVKGINQAFGSFGGGVVQKIVVPFVMVGEAITTAISILAEFEGKGEELGQGFAKAVVAPIQGAIALIGGIWKNTINQLQPIIQPLATGLVMSAVLIKMAWLSAADTILGAWNWLVGKAVGIRDSLVGFLNHGAADAVAFAWQRSVTNITNAWNWLVVQATSVREQITQAFIDSFNSVIVNNWNRSVTNITNTWNWLVAQATSVREQILDSFGRNVTDVAVSAWQTAISKIGNIWSSLNLFTPTPVSQDFVGPVIPDNLEDATLFDKGLGLIIKGIPDAIQAIQNYFSFTGRTIEASLQNMDTFGLAMLSLASLPGNLIKRLKPSQSMGAVRAISSELVDFVAFIERGIPKALSLALPAGVALGIAAGWNKGLEDWAVNTLVSAPEFFRSTITQVLDSISTSTKTSLKVNLGFDLDAKRPEIDEFIDQTTEKFRQLVNYLLNVGAAAQQMGSRILDNLRPLLELKFNFGPLTIRPLEQFLVVAPAFKGFVEMLKSPAIAGGLKLIGTALTAVYATVQGIVLATTALFLGVGQVIVSFLLGSKQVQAAEQAIIGAASEAKKNVLSLEEQIISIGKGIYQVGKALKDGLITQIKAIPVIGNLVAASLEFMIAQVVRFAKTIPLIISSLRNAFAAVITPQFIANFQGAFSKLFIDIGAGIAYVVSTNLKAVKNLLTIFGNFPEIYRKTLGLKDLFEGITPLDIIYDKLFPEQKILALKLADIINARTSLLNNAGEAIKKAGFIAQVEMRLLYISPFIEMISGTTIALFTLRAVLEPLGEQFFQNAKAIQANISQMGQYGPILAKVFGGVVTSLWVLKYATIAVTETILFTLKILPPLARIIQSTFTNLGTVVGFVSKVLAVTILGIATLTKGIIAAPLLAVPIAVLGVVDAILYATKAALQALKAITTYIGDAVSSKVNQYFDAFGRLFRMGDWKTIGSLLFQDLIVTPFQWTIGAALGLAINLGKSIVQGLVYGVAGLRGAIVTTFNALVFAVTNPAKVIELIRVSTMSALNSLNQQLKQFLPPIIYDNLGYITGAIAGVVGSVFSLMNVFATAKNPIEAVGMASELVAHGAVAAATSTWGMIAAISGLVAAIATFSVVEYIRKFKELDAIVSWVSGKIGEVNTLIGQMWDVITKPIAPGFADALSGFIQTFISAMPTVIVVITLIAMAMKKSIGGGISFVAQGIGTIVSKLMEAVKAAMNFGSAMKTAATSFESRTKLQGVSHNVRSRFMGKGPLGYESEDIMQLRGQQLEKGKSIVAYQKRVNKLLIQEQKRREKEIVAMSRSPLASVAGSVEGMTEQVEKKGLFGKKTVTQLSQKGRAQLEKEFFGQMAYSKQGSKFDDEGLNALAEKTGVLAAYKKSGVEADSAHLRDLAFGDQAKMQNIFDQFDKAVIGEARVSNMIVGSLDFNQQAKKTLSKRYDSASDYVFQSEDIKQIKTKSASSNQAKEILKILAEYDDVDSQLKELSLSALDSKDLYKIAKGIGVRELPKDLEYDSGNLNLQADFTEFQQELASFKILDQLGKVKGNEASRSALFPSQIHDSLMKDFTSFINNNTDQYEFEYSGKELSTILNNPAFRNAKGGEDAMVEILTKAAKNATDEGQIHAAVSDVVHQLMQEQLELIRKEVLLPEIPEKAKGLADDLKESGKKIRIGFREVLGGAITDFFANFKTNTSALVDKVKDSKQYQQFTDKRQSAKEAKIVKDRMAMVEKIRKQSNIKSDFELVQNTGVAYDYKRAFLGQAREGATDFIFNGSTKPHRLTKELSVGDGKKFEDIYQLFATNSTENIIAKLPPGVKAQLQKYGQSKGTDLKGAIEVLKRTKAGMKGEFTRLIGGGHSGEQIGKALGTINRSDLDVGQISSKLQTDNRSIYESLKLNAEKQGYTVEQAIISIKHGKELIKSLEDALAHKDFITPPRIKYTQLYGKYAAQIQSFIRQKSATGFDKDIRDLLETKFAGAEHELDDFINSLHSKDDQDIFAELIYRGLIPETKDLATLEKTFGISISKLEQGSMNSPRMKALLEVAKGNLYSPDVKKALKSGEINHKDIDNVIKQVAKLGNIDPDQLRNPGITIQQVRKARAKRQEIFASKGKDFSQLLAGLEPAQLDSLNRGQITDLPKDIQKQITKAFGLRGDLAVQSLEKQLSTSTLLRGENASPSGALKNLTSAPFKALGKMTGVSSIIESSRYRSELIGIQNETIVAEQQQMAKENAKLAKARTARLAGLEAALVEAKRSRKEVDQLLGGLKPVFDQFIQTGKFSKKISKDTTNQLASLLNVQGEDGLEDFYKKIKEYEFKRLKLDSNKRPVLDAAGKPVKETYTMNLTGILEEFLNDKKITQEETDHLVKALKELNIIQDPSQLKKLATQVEKSGGKDYLLEFLKTGKLTQELTSDEQKTITEALGLKNFKDVERIADIQIPTLTKIKLQIANYFQKLTTNLTEFDQTLTRSIEKLRPIPFVGDILADTLLKWKDNVAKNFIKTSDFLKALVKAPQELIERLPGGKEVMAGVQKIQAASNAYKKDRATSLQGLTQDAGYASIEQFRQEFKAALVNRGIVDEERQTKILNAFLQPDKDGIAKAIKADKSLRDNQKAIEQAFADSVSIPVASVSQMIRSNTYTVAAVKPFQVYLLKVLPGAMLDLAVGIGKGAVGFVTTFKPVQTFVKAGLLSLGGTLGEIESIFLGVSTYLEIAKKQLRLDAIPKNAQKRLVLAYDKLRAGVIRKAADTINSFRLAGVMPRKLKGLEDSLYSLYEKIAIGVDKQIIDLVKAPRANIGFITTAVGRLWKSIWRSITDIQGTVERAKNSTLGQIFKTVFQTFKNIWQGIGSLLGQAYNPRGVRGGVAPPPRPPVRDEAAIKREIKQTQASLPVSITNETEMQQFKSAFQKFEDLTQELNTLKASRPTLSQKIQGIYTSVASEVGSVLQDSKGFIKNLFAKTGRFFTNIGNQLQSPIPKRTTVKKAYYQKFNTGKFYDDGLQIMGSPVRGQNYGDEEIVNIQEKIKIKLINIAKNTSLAVGNILSNAPSRIVGAWRRATRTIERVIYSQWLRNAVQTGIQLVMSLNHGAADVTAAAWERTQESTTQNMHQMAQTAQATGEQISHSMTNAATKPVSLFARLGQAIGHVGKAGFAIGGAVMAVGFAAQQAASSLTTMGIINEETSQKIYKLTEVFTLLGAVGGVVAPIMGAVMSSLGAVASVAGAVITAITGVGGAIFTFFISPVGLAVAGITAAILLANAAIKNFFGVDLLGQAFRAIGSGLRSGFGQLQALIPGLVSNLTSALDTIGSVITPIAANLLSGIKAIFLEPFAPLMQPLVDAFTGAVTTIKGAWQGFINEFGGNLFGIIQPALDVAQGLINALNHSPTEKIPAAWQGAVENIQGFLGDLLKFASGIGASLVAAMGVKKLGEVIHTRASQPTRNRAIAFSNKIEKASMYANFANDVAELSGVELPDFVAPLLKATTFIGVLGDLTTEVLPQLCAAFTPLKTVIASAFGALSGAVGGVIPMLGIVGIAMAAFVAAWHFNLFGIQEKTQFAIDGIKNGFIWAIAQIGSAWQFFVDNFGAKLTPIIQPALDVAQGLINALNHNPTVKIPIAWEGAVNQIKNGINTLPETASNVGEKLNKNLLPQAQKWWDKLWSFGKKAESLPEQNIVPATEDLGVKLNFSKQLTQAIAIAKGAGDTAAVAQLGSLPPEMTSNEYAKLILPGAEGTGGKYLQTATSLINQRQGIENPIGASVANLFTKTVPTPQLITATPSLLNAPTATTTSVPATAPTPEPEKQSFWSKLSSFFTPKAPAPAPAPIDPGVMLDFTKQLEQAINIAAGAGDAAAVSQLKGLSGNMSVNEYAKLATAETGGGKYLKTAVALDNQRRERERYGAIAGNVASTGVAALRGQESWGDFGTALSNLSKESVGIFNSSEIGQQINTGLSVAKSGATDFMLEIQDRWSFLEREGFADIGALFEPGIDQAKAGFGELGQYVGDFASEVGQSILHLDFPRLASAAMDFGTNAGAALKQIASGFGSAGLSAVVFGVYSLVALSPVGFALGAIALAGLAVATNFLGLRNIIFGLVKIAGGLIQILVATVQAINRVAQGIGLIINGIQTLDLDTIKLGFQTTFSAITQYVQQLWQAIAQIANGIGQTFRGLFQGISQLFRGLVSAFLSPFAGVRAAITSVVGAVKNLGSNLKSAITEPSRVWEAFLRLLDRIQAKITGVLGAVSSSGVGQAVRVIKKRVTGESGSLRAAREQVNFEERLKGKEPGSTLAERAAAGRARIGRFFNRGKQAQPTVIPETTPNTPVEAKKGGFFGRFFNRGKQAQPTVVPETPITPSEATPVTQVPRTRGIFRSKTTTNQLPPSSISPVNIPLQRQPEPAPRTRGIFRRGSESETPTRGTRRTPPSIDIRETTSNASSALSSLGNTLSFFAPQLSGPLFAVSALTDSFLSLGLVVPQLKTAIAASFPTLASYVTSTYAAGGASAVFSGILDVLKTKALAAWGVINSGGIVKYIASTLAATGVTGLFSTAFTWLGTTASAAWIAITGPLLPFIALAGVAVGAITLIYLAFKNNFLGISTLFGGIIGGFKTFFGTLLGGAWDAIASVFSTITQELGNLWNVLVVVGQSIIAPFKPLFDLFGGSGGDGGLFGDFGKILADTILLPIRLVAGTINLLIRGVSTLIQVAVVLGGVLTSLILAPLRLVMLIGQGLFATLKFIADIVVTIGQFVFQGIVWPFQQLGSALVSLGQVVVGFVLNPFETIAGLIKNITGFLAGIPIIGNLFGGGKQQESTPIQKFSSGGLVKGPGTSTGDRVPAMLSPGEFVVSSSATRSNLSLLDAVNSGAQVVPQVVPIPLPPIVQPVPVVTTATESSELPPMNFNFTFGDIVIQGGNGSETANEFLDEIEPQLEQRVKQILRRLAEFKK